MSAPAFTIPRVPRGPRVSRRLTVALFVCITAFTSAPAAASTWHVAPGGRGGACSAAAPCASFDSAYDRAKPGDTVLVAGGTYDSTQKLTGDKRSKTPVFVKSAPGARVIIQGRLDVQADFVRVTGPMQIEDGIDVDDSGTSNPIVGVRISGVTSPSSYIENARELLIANSRLGGVPGQAIVMIGARPTSHRIAFDNVTFYGNVPTASTQHLECIFATGVQGLSVRNSSFSRCGYFNILIGMCCGAERQPSRLVLEGNKFGASVCFAGAGGCGQDGRAPYSLMLGTRIDGRSSIRRNYFETPPSAQAGFESLTADGNTGAAPSAWKH